MHTEWGRQRVKASNPSLAVEFDNKRKQGGTNALAPFANSE